MNNFNCQFLNFEEFISKDKTYHKLTILLNNRTTDLFINDNKDKTLIKKLRECNYLDTIVLEYNLYINKSGILSIIITDFL